MKFDLQSEYQPDGDQPQAIAELVEGVNTGPTSNQLTEVFPCKAQPLPQPSLGAPAPPQTRPLNLP
ncbi:MAG: hypothetical protein CL834_06370 [Crocinitomicaceae bacterium]|nr:hypothetical protein [Crocinitomicaceae bacterium]